MVIHHRLENALARADELLTVGNQGAALQLLFDAIMTRWFQHNLLSLDAIMMRFVELCVELRKGKLVRDGLYQYRSVSQAANTSGLEAVLKHFVAIAEDKLNEAHRLWQATSSEEASPDLEHEQEEEGAEETLASVWGVSLGADGGKQQYRLQVTPWLRFAWEAYRIVLDLCRHNGKLETVYGQLVESAFSWCRKWERPAELRRLCEMLRHHLGLIVKYPGQVHGIVLTGGSPSAVASQELQLALRFVQLQVATEMELWQEVFRSLEDIHGLFVLARKVARPAMVRLYYERLGTVFAQSKNHLFLAETHCKLFALSHETADAETAVLSLLSVPLLTKGDPTCSLGEEDHLNKKARLAYFLGLNKAPTVASVAKQIKPMLSSVDAKVASLYSSLSVLFGPSAKAVLSMEQAKQIIQGLAQGQRFAPFILANVFTCLLNHLSRESHCVKLSLLNELLYGFDFDLKAFLLAGSLSGDLHILLDEERDELLFTRPCFAEDPVLQMDDSSLNSSFQLAKLMSLVNARLGLEPRMIPSLGRSVELLEVEHKANLARKTIIEKRKEKLEEEQARKEREEQREHAMRLRAEQEAEAVRLAEEVAKREQQRKEVERQEIRRQQALKRDEDEKLRKEAAARRAGQEKLIAMVRKLDYLERAMRKEEQPLLKDDYEKQKEADRISYEERVQTIMARAKSQFEADRRLCGRLLELQSDQVAFLSALKDQRKKRFEEKSKENEALIVLKKAELRAKEMKKREEKLALEKAEQENKKIAEQQYLREQEAEGKKRFIPPHLRSSPPASVAADAPSSTAGSSSGWRRAG